MPCARQCGVNSPQIASLPVPSQPGAPLEDASGPSSKTGRAGSSKGSSIFPDIMAAVSQLNGEGASRRSLGKTDKAREEHDKPIADPAGSAPVLSDMDAPQRGPSPLALLDLLGAGDSVDGATNSGVGEKENAGTSGDSPANPALAGNGAASTGAQTIWASLLNSGLLSLHPNASRFDNSETESPEKASTADEVTIPASKTVETHDACAKALPASLAAAGQAASKPATKDELPGKQESNAPGAEIPLSAFAPVAPSQAASQEISPKTSGAEPTASTHNPSHNDLKDALTAAPGVSGGNHSREGMAAFAMRLSSQDGHDREHSDQGQNANPAVPTSKPEPAAMALHASAAAAKQEIEKHASDSGSIHASDAPVASPLTSVADSEKTTERGESQSSVRPLPTDAPETTRPAEASHSEPVRSVHLQVPGENNQRVDLRMIHHEGELRVSVRAADSSLAQALQSHMPELTARLGEQHFHAEVWTPRLANSAETGNTRERGFSSPEGGDRGGADSGQQQNGGQKQKPHWLEELDEDYPRRPQISRSN